MFTEMVGVLNGKEGVINGKEGVIPTKVGVFTGYLQELSIFITHDDLWKFEIMIRSRSCSLL